MVTEERRWLTEIVLGKFIVAGYQGLVDVPAMPCEWRSFIVPGFIDGNVHFFPWPSWTYIEFLARYEGRFEEIIEESAQIALSYGVTTAFDSMGPVIPGLNVRDRINRGEIVGPRLFIAGNIVGFRAVFTTVESIKSASSAFQARINALFEMNVGPDLVWMSPEQFTTRCMNMPTW